MKRLFLFLLVVGCDRIHYPDRLQFVDNDSNKAYIVRCDYSAECIEVMDRVCPFGYRVRDSEPGEFVVVCKDPISVSPSERFGN